RMERSVRYTLSVKDVSVTTAGEVLVFSGRIYEGENLIVEVTSGFPVRTKKRVRRQLKTDSAGERTLLRTLEFVTEKRQPYDYAYASGDMNPIHRSVLFARVAGFGMNIMHGMCVIGMCERVMINNLTDNEYCLPRAMSGRFSSPVFPGEKLYIRVFEPRIEGDAKVYEYEAVNARGKVVIRNGKLTV
ncbi:MAG TPA: MaoC/PaaZ C-terminal domain-containing protein, partial [Spirochaetota bacterium]|nr:MaoC/PaaZ C-terminal domain-containing protein [Spirochaetota bacterium]